MTELHELGALDQAAALRDGTVSAVELVGHHLDRIAALNDRLGAFVTVTAESAREQARAADKRLREGAEGLPPLFGVPTSIKDLAGTSDAPTTFGSLAFRGFVPPVDAHVVSLLRAAGTISLGKTNTAEFGHSAYSDTDVAGSARTPWDLTRSAGGSSGGAAASVAARLVPFAHGTDGGGSIRIPASVCGLFGLKPSRGRISNGPMGHDPVGLACHGPLARNVRDAAAMLDAMAVPMPGDPYWAEPLPAGDTYLGWTGRDPGTLRIARFAGTGTLGVPVDPACLEAYEAATRLLEDLGHVVEEIPSPFGEEVVEPFEVCWATRALQAPVAPGDEELLRPVTRWWRARGRQTTAEQFLAALNALERLGRRAVTAVQPYDAVLTPTLAMPPRPPSWFTETGDLLVETRRQTAFSPYAAGCNITGQPAATLPLHWTADGLPIGVMLAGRPHGEARLLSLCAQIEAARPWADRRPPLDPTH